MHRLTGALLAATTAVLCHLNALSAEFAFDDHFAITYNGDVTDANKPLAALWRNDWWGQDVRGEGRRVHAAIGTHARRVCCLGSGTMAAQRRRAQSGAREPPEPPAACSPGCTCKHR